MLLVLTHGAVAGDVANFYSALAVLLAGGIKLKRWLTSFVSGVIASAILLCGLAFTKVRRHVHQLHGLLRG